MSIDSKFTHGLARIDVRLGDYEDSDTETIWQVRVRQAESVEAKIPVILFQGYLRCRTTDGMGQALSIGVLPDYKLEDVVSDGSLNAEFERFANNYVVESLYDQARRALESQSAAMDFSFKLDLECPETEFLLANAQVAEE
ncbi:hypothetical protein EDF60_1705 [Leucobacter luti]|uniref:hypothetical protein n=1 Tax=Leucobacter luti TaxID=340320 RepID=UPI0010431B1C|nr:hypothetical protein [Leucobacter luti]MCW2287054.1 hypothetical protein [Leucobacter luti]TCK41279.1 hypothetical protein EDF60_1705 [Leucobacter luti]